MRLREGGGGGVCGGVGGVPQKGNEQSNKKGKKNRSVKVHGREVKQFPFERETKEYRGVRCSSARWMRERQR